MPNGMDIPHIRISGYITFVNSGDNFLNAEQRPMIKSTLLVAFIYAVLLAFWAKKMHQFRDHAITLHTVIAVVLSVCFAQTLINFAYFTFENTFGHRSLVLLHFGIIFEVLRSTFARVVLLLLALGYGVLIKSV